MAAARIFSYRVLWFERDGPGFKPAEAYPKQALACLASHDLPTFAGWRRGRDIEIGRAIGQIGEAEVPARKALRAARAKAPRSWFRTAGRAFPPTRASRR